ncbi:unnamed protein product, partial [Prorocentrum cordatum]
MLSFWTGLAVMGALFLLVPSTFGIAMVLIVPLGVYWRQQLRRLFGYSHNTATSLSQDCLAWTLCCLCAIVQEAREVEHVQREPPPVRLSNAQLAHDVSRGRGDCPRVGGERKWGSAARTSARRLPARGRAGLRSRARTSSSSSPRDVPRWQSARGVRQRPQHQQRELAGGRRCAPAAGHAARRTESG